MVDINNFEPDEYTYKIRDYLKNDSKLLIAIFSALTAIGSVIIKAISLRFVEGELMYYSVKNIYIESNDFFQGYNAIFCIFISAIWVLLASFFSLFLSNCVDLMHRCLGILRELQRNKREIRKMKRRLFRTKHKTRKIEKKGYSSEVIEIEHETKENYCEMKRLVNANRDSRRRTWGIIILLIRYILVAYLLVGLGILFSTFFVNSSFDNLVGQLRSVGISIGLVAMIQIVAEVFRRTSERTKEKHNKVEKGAGEDYTDNDVNQFTEEDAKKLRSLFINWESLLSDYMIKRGGALLFALSLFFLAVAPLLSNVSARNVRTYAIVEENEDIYAVVYSGKEDFIMVRCAEEGDSLLLFVNEQRVASNEDIRFRKKTYGSVERRYD